MASYFDQQPLTGSTGFSTPNTTDLVKSSQDIIASKLSRVRDSADKKRKLLGMKPVDVPEDMSRYGDYQPGWSDSNPPPASAYPKEIPNPYAIPQDQSSGREYLDWAGAGQGTAQEGRLSESGDLAQSAGIQQYAKVSDALRRGSRALVSSAGINPDDIGLVDNANLVGLDYSAKDIMSNPAIADKIAGYAGREGWDKEKKNMLDLVKNEKYGQAALSVVMNFDRYLAESAPETAQLMVPYLGLPSVVGTRLSEQMTAYEKANNKPMSAAKAMETTAAILTTLVPEKLLIKSGAQNVLAGLTGKTGVAKAATGVAGSAVGEGLQEGAEQIQETYATQKEGDRTLMEIAQSPEVKAGAIAGAVIGGGLRGGGETAVAAATIPQKVEAYQYDKKLRTEAMNTDPNVKDIVDTFTQLDASELKAEITRVTDMKAEMQKMSPEEVAAVAARSPQNEIGTASIVLNMENSKKILANPSLETRYRTALAEVVATDENLRNSFNTMLGDTASIQPDMSVEQIASILPKMTVDTVKRLQPAIRPAELLGKTASGAAITKKAMELLTNAEQAHKITADNADQKIAAQKKAAPPVRKNDIVTTSDKLDDGVIKGLLNKGAKQVYGELQGYTTESLKSAMNVEGTSNRMRSMIERVIRDRKDANKAAGISNKSLGILDGINMGDLLDKGRAEAIKSLKNLLTTKQIAVKETAESIKELIDGAKEKGFVTADQAKIMHKRVDAISKDAITADEFKAITAKAKEEESITNPKTTDTPKAETPPKSEAKPDKKVDTKEEQDPTIREMDKGTLMEKAESVAITSEEEIAAAREYIKSLGAIIECRA